MFREVHIDNMVTKWWLLDREPKAHWVFSCEESRQYSPRWGRHVNWEPTGKPDGVQPVEDFELNKYLGKWYEIARLDHSFERGLNSVSAEYSLREDGGVKVINRGYSEKDSEWKQSEGKAYFVESPDRGYLKVSFFGPFYGSYLIFELERENYQYAFVSGPDTSYLWLLSRAPTIGDELMQHFIIRAEEYGFDTEKLIYVEHSQDH